MSTKDWFKKWWFKLGCLTLGAAATAALITTAVEVASTNHVVNNTANVTIGSYGDASKRDVVGISSIKQIEGTAQNDGEQGEIIYKNLKFNTYFTFEVGNAHFAYSNVTVVYGRQLSSIPSKDGKETPNVASADQADADARFTYWLKTYKQQQKDQMNEIMKSLKNTKLDDDLKLDSSSTVKYKNTKDLNNALKNSLIWNTNDKNSDQNSSHYYGPEENIPLKQTIPLDKGTSLDPAESHHGGIVISD